MAVTDDELRIQLRRIDPAASMAPLPREDASMLVDRAMDEPVARKTRAFGRPLVKPLAAAAALLAAVVAGVLVNLGGSSEPGSPSPVVERVISNDAGAQAKCVPPTPQELRTVAVAVEGTVREIEDGVVTLAVSRVWAGPKADVLEVAQAGGASEVLMGGTAFEVGQAYLVAADDGGVRGCGYSGVASPELKALYAEAFS